MDALPKNALKHILLMLPRPHHALSTCRAMNSISSDPAFLVDWVKTHRGASAILSACRCVAGRAHHDDVQRQVILHTLRSCECSESEIVEAMTELIETCDAGADAAFHVLFDVLPDVTDESSRRLFHAAARAGNHAIAEHHFLLLPNTPPPLSTVAETGNVRLLKASLKTKKVDKTDLDAAMMAAVCNGHVAAARLLLHHGADANYGGGIYVMKAISLPEVALVRMVKLLLANGADPNANLNRALYLAVAERHSACLVKILLSYGADADESDALIHAARNGLFDIAEMLVREGATVRYDVMLAAIRSNCVRTTRILLQYIIPQSISTVVDDVLVDALHRNGRAEIVQVLVDAGANLAGNHIFQPLTQAVSIRRHDMATILIHAGAAATHEHLHIAILLGDVAIVDLLLESGATASIDALVTAACQSNTDMMNVLVTAGADVSEAALSLMKMYMDSGLMTLVDMFGDRIDARRLVMRFLEYGKCDRALLIRFLDLAVVVDADMLRHAMKYNTSVSCFELLVSKYECDEVVWWSLVVESIDCYKSEFFAALLVRASATKTRERGIAVCKELCSGGRRHNIDACTSMMTTFTNHFDSSIVLEVLAGRWRRVGHSMMVFLLCRGIVPDTKDLKDAFESACHMDDAKLASLIALWLPIGYNYVKVARRCRASRDLVDALPKMLQNSPARAIGLVGLCLCAGLCVSSALVSLQPFWIISSRKILDHLE